MPKLSPTMEEGQISNWVKEEGEAIEENETIAEVDTDKATMEMTSLEAGTLLKILVPAGENAKLGQTIGIIGEKGEDISKLLKEVSSEQLSVSSNEDVPGTKTPDASAQEISTSPTLGSAPQTLDTGHRTPDSNNGRLFVSPIAAKMAS